MASAGCTEMAAAGYMLHPACRVRQEGFGLLFYDSRGPRLLFAETGNLLDATFIENLHQENELPVHLTGQQKSSVDKFIRQLLERGFLREQ